MNIEYTVYVVPQNMSEAEPKITVQVKQHLQIYIRIQNPAKYLKWSKKKRLAKTKYSPEPFPKNVTKYLTGG